MAYVVPADPQGRALDCDLIMKGGVTSGLVYPGAITALANQYRLRSIGGTSAGAIAAVAAAAMEYGLQTRPPAEIDGKDPRAELANLPTQVLARQTDQGATQLEAMFSGDPGTAALLDAIKSALAGKWPKIYSLLGPAWQTRTCLANTAWATALQAIAGGAAAGGLAGLWSANTALVVAAALIGGAASLCGALRLNVDSLMVSLPLSRADANRLLQPVVDNGLGLSTGMTPPPHTIAGHQVPALIPWLHQTIQSLAGLSADKPQDVLTFGKLWTLGSVDKPSSSDPRAIDLILVCSDLNRMQSGSFPFLPDNQRLFFDPDAWVKLFPAPVVEAIVGKSFDIAGIKAAALKLDYTDGDLSID